ncbi:MAG TPA: PEP-CTERM sorting domain-containing protein, partial [Gemmataceae bacterium]|nr:PEP-CTERM sorting domain-containing protein [Gemmataceae bacterium]
KSACPAQTEQSEQMLAQGKCPPEIPAMEGYGKWLRHLRAPACAIAIMLTTSLASAPAAAQEPVNSQKLSASEAKEQWQRLEHGWSALREDLTRVTLEATLTTFFIRGAPPPPPPQKKPPPPPPPPGPNNPPPNNPPPPPPNGQGEPPVIIDPPPPVSSTPEPGSMIIALTGIGLAAGYAWRKRRKS